MPLVTRTRYNAKGEPFETVDPKGIVTRTEFDALGRKVRTIQNYLPGSTAPDANITTEFTYKAGHLTAVTAVNAATGNQTTRYEYGVSPATGSLVSRNDLLRETIYPDGGLDTVKHRYNRQGERIGMTDQNGTVHAYELDKLGRLTADEVTSLGTGIDGTVRKLGTTYNARGLVEKLTSYGPTGSVVNEVKNTYNGLNQLTEQAQSHAGAVTGGTPKVEYGYDHSASGGVFTKGARPTDITYPSGRVIDFDYGSAGGAGDKLGRIEALVDGAQTLVAYSYLGVGTFVVTDYVEPEVKLAYTAAASGDAKYPGFDQYNRVVQHHWIAHGASPGLCDGFDYGYDANSNRLWRANLTAQALDKPFDELYRYDRLNRLVDFQRGTLNAEHTAILGAPTKEQTWNLDPTGNWSQFTSTDDGVLETDQTRISNPANEITEISSWFPPGYDHAGNMTRIPKPAAPQEGFLATWDAWNRMVKLVDAGTSDTVQENAFDAQTWRTVRKDYEADSLSETRHFFYTAQWQSVEERLDAATTPERQHVWGLRYIDDLILRDRDTDNDGDLDERLYAMQDANWNVTGIIDDAGDVQERYTYQPYGNHVVLSVDFEARSPLIIQWHRLGAGLPYDGVSCTYKMRMRTYHPILGVWASRDPFTDDAFQFVSSNPITAVDPFGLQAHAPVRVPSITVVPDPFVIDLRNAPPNPAQRHMMVEQAAVAELNRNEVPPFAANEIVYGYPETDAAFRNARGQSNFVIGVHQGGRVSAVPMRCPCDFSDVRVKVLGYFWVVDNNPDQRRIILGQGTGRQRILNYTAIDTIHHERVHVAGSGQGRNEDPAIALLRRTGAAAGWNIGPVVGFIPQAQAFTLDTRGAFLRLTAPAGMVVTDQWCRDRANEILRDHLTGQARRQQILEAGFWHESIVADVNFPGEEFYTWRGAAPIGGP